MARKVLADPLNTRKQDCLLLMANTHIDERRARLGRKDPRYSGNLCVANSFPEAVGLNNDVTERIFTTNSR